MSITAFAPRILAPALLERDHLVAPGVLKHLAGNSCSRDSRRAELWRVATNDQHLAELHNLARLTVDTVDPDHVFGGDNVTIGTPTVAGASVAGEVVEQTRGAKVIAFKKRRRKNSRRKRGHRQELSVIRITEILTDGRKPTPRPQAAEAAAEPTAAPELEAEAVVGVDASETPEPDASETAEAKPAKKRARKPAAAKSADEGKDNKK